MATVNYTANALAPLNHAFYTWTPLTTTNTDGAPVGFAGSGKTAQVTGTFGVGGTLVMQESVDGTNWVTMTDSSVTGGAVSFTATGVKDLRETAPFVRPFVSGGDGTTSLTVTLACRRALVNA